MKVHVDVVENSEDFEGTPPFIFWHRVIRLADEAYEY
jgi:hypothetical protein